MDNGSADATKKLDIRKYPNRRYYDATRSQHVKLEEMYELIRQGYEIQVTDSKTGQDITPKVLAQIILELDPPKLDIFPVPLLHRLIRANEQLVQEFTEKYFNRALECFLESQKHFETYLRQAVGLQPAMPDWTRMMFNPFMANPLLSAFLPRAESGRNVNADQADQASTVRQQIGELQRQIRELESQLPQKPSGSGNS